MPLALGERQAEVSNRDQIEAQTEPSITFAMSELDLFFVARHARMLEAARAILLLHAFGARRKTSRGE